MCRLDAPTRVERGDRSDQAGSAWERPATLITPDELDSGHCPALSRPQELRLARIEAARPTPWASRYLQLVADQPGIVSRVLAPPVDADVPPFKRRVRQLKELGLTESLEVGYRLSPRGGAVLERLTSDPR